MQHDPIPHTRGNHADDFSDTELCDCMDVHKVADVDVNSCGCCENNHSPKTTHTEDWEGIRAAIDVKPHEQFGKVDTWALDVAIKELLTAARESALREALEALPKEEDPAKRLNTFKEGFKSGWNLHAEQSIRAITARLLDT